MGLEGYGLEGGCKRDLVLLQAGDPIEAIRLKAARLFVLRRGKVVAETPPVMATLYMQQAPEIVDFRTVQY